MLSITAITDDSLIRPTTQLRFFDGVLQQKYVNTHTNEEEWMDVEVVVSAKERVSKKIPPAFNLPPVVQEKVSIEEFLGMLRERVNKKYMPTSTGLTKHNSKPEYTDRTISVKMTNLDIVYTIPDISIMDSSGYICLEGGNDKPIYAYLDLGTIQIVVNLWTEGVLLKLKEEAIFSFWSKRSPHLLAIDRMKLTEEIDVFL